MRALIIYQRIHAHTHTRAGVTKRRSTNMIPALTLVCGVQNLLYAVVRHVFHSHHDTAAVQDLELVSAQ